MSIRAVRNNNPGNIRIGASWQGLMPRDQMTAEQKAEDEFCVFEAPRWGFRAVAEIVLNYHKLHQINTIREIIERWAPPSENDTDAYVKDVCHHMAFEPDDQFPFSSVTALGLLVMAISIHECGGWFFKEDDLLNGVTAAH